MLHSGDGFGLTVFVRVVETDIGEIEVVPCEVLGSHETGTSKEFDSLARNENKVLSFGHIVEVFGFYVVGSAFGGVKFY